MSHLRILDPFPTDLSVIYISALGVSTVVENGEEFILTPYESYHNLGVVAGYVKVFKQDKNFIPGVYRKLDAVNETSDGGNSLVALKPEDFPQNKYV